MANRPEAPTSSRAAKRKKVDGSHSFNISDVVDYIPSMATKWMPIGLKLEQKDLVQCLLDSDKSQETKLTQILMQWEGTGRASWQVLLDTLKSEAVQLVEVAKKIMQKVDLECNETLEVATGTVHDSVQQTQMVETLQSKLIFIRENRHQMVWRKESEREERIKLALDDYFAKHAEMGSCVNLIEKEIETLYDTEQLLPRVSYCLAREEIGKIKELLLRDSANGGSSSASETEVLFSKENIYHAMICCEALECPSPGDHFNSTGNIIDCFTVSRSDCDAEKHGGKTHGKFLVAKKRNVYFITFQGIREFTQWTQYRSFEEGFQKQADCIPWNCFVQLLREGAQLIFTGFSMGASLACTVVASMLQDNLLSQEVITGNLACITFGQPLIALASLEKLFSEREYLRNCFHYVYVSDDAMPMLLMYAAVGQHATGQDYYSSTMLDTVVSLQERSRGIAPSSRSTEVNQTATLLTQFLRHTMVQGGLQLATGHFYAVSHVTSDSEEDACPPMLRWKPVTNAQVYDLLLNTTGNAQCENLLTYWQQHTLKLYLKRVFCGFLDQQPPYKLPTEIRVVPNELPKLHPEIESIEIHCYDKENCIMVSGKGLWFARDLKLDHTQVLYTHPKENTNLQFQVTKTGDFDRAAEELPDTMTAQLGSCLSKYVTKQLPVTVKNYSMSVRQAQLAKLTPVDLIEIAMLSVALERRATTGGVYSERYHAVQEFFNTAMDVVPIESVVYALRAEGYLYHDILSVEDFYALRGMQSYCSLLLDNYERNNPFSHLGNLPKMGLTLPQRIWPFAANDLITAHLGASFSQQAQFTTSFGQQVHVAASVAQQVQSTPSATKQPVISGMGIKMLFTNEVAELDPRNQLKKAREDVDELVIKQSTNSQSNASLASDCTNVEILRLISNIQAQARQFSQLVDAFMKSQVKVPLLNSPRDTARVLDESQEALGVWYLIGLNYANMSQILSDGKLVIDVINYLGSFLPENQRMMGYSAKAQFINQAMSTTVSCSSEHVCYSLERQLKELCLKCGIGPTTTTEELCSSWETFFREKILSFVALPHRPLLARWIKWMLAVHDLRESLAKQTVIGVIGLMNSGKSTLMNKIFCQKIPSGTRECKRTTVPFLYNLGPEIEEMDIIDFPGVNDSSDDIRALCEVIFEMAQMILFIVDYKNAHSVMSMNWLRVISQSGMPALICLTFGDRLFAEQMTHRDYPNPEVISKIISDHIKDFREKFMESIGVAPPECMLCSIATSNDSVLGDKEGRRRLRDAGIKGSEDIAHWILRVLNKRGQTDLAKKLEACFGPQLTLKTP